MIALTEYRTPKARSVEGQTLAGLFRFWSDMNIERRYIPAEELRVEGEGENRSLSWFPAVFDSLSEDLGGFREVIKPRAFTKTTQEQDIRALWNHDPNYVLGRNKAQPTPTLDLHVNRHGLRASVTPPDTQWARDLMVSIDRGDVNAGSFGFQVLKDNWRQDHDTGEVIRELQEVRLFDVSVVTYPAYPATEGVALRAALRGTGVELDDIVNPLLLMRAGQPLAGPALERYLEAVEQLRAKAAPPSSDEDEHAEGKTWRLNIARLRMRMAANIA